MTNNQKNTKLIGGLNGIKLTYFVLFFAYGATLPYLALYFRQIGLNASYVGAIAGVRPIVQFISCPLWAIIADKFRIRRLILNMSIICWLLFTVVLYIPRPNFSYCLDQISNNNSLFNLNYKKSNIPYIIKVKNSIKQENLNLTNYNLLQNKRTIMDRLNSFQYRNPEHNHVSLRHLLINNTQNITNIKNSTCPVKNLKQKFSKPISAVFLDEEECIPLVFYETEQVWIVFIILFTLTAVGEFFEAPSVSLLDVAILECFDTHMENYGKIRLYGSLGFGISSFVVGLTLDQFHIKICDKIVTNFMITLYFFVGSMILAIITSLICIRYNNDKIYFNGLKIFKNINNKSNKFIESCSVCQNFFNDELKDNFLNNETKQNGLKEVYNLFKNPNYAFYITISLFLGFSHGSIMNFINWFLEDLGASRLMMGSATVIRDFAVVFGFYISPHILTIFTQFQVITWTFLVYIFSYFCYSIISAPWYAVPVECLQGLAYAIMWSSCITYFAGAVSKENCATMQGVIQGVYWGLGTGSGAIIGGMSVFKYGCSKSFQLGGYVTCFAFVFFVILYVLFVKKAK